MVASQTLSLKLQFKSNSHHTCMGEASGGHQRDGTREAMKHVVAVRLRTLRFRFSIEPIPRGTGERDLGFERFWLHVVFHVATVQIQQSPFLTFCRLRFRRLDRSFWFGSNPSDSFPLLEMVGDFFCLCSLQLFFYPKTRSVNTDRENMLSGKKNKRPRGWFNG